MSTPTEVFVKTFKNISTGAGVELTESKPLALVKEFETKLPSEVVTLKAVGTVARSFTSTSQIFEASAIHGKSFVNRAAAVLALGSFAQTVTSRLNPGVPSKRHHWAPVCFTKRFRKDTRRKITRGAAMPAYDPTLDDSVEIPQLALILPFTRHRGYNTQALEGMFSQIETGYTHVMKNTVEDEEFQIFTLSLFALFQEVRMNRADYDPPKNIGGFATKVLELLEMRLEPSIHRLDSPVGFSSEHYFRKSDRANGIVFVAPVSKRVVVTFAKSSVSNKTRELAIANLEAKQHAGARLSNTLIFGSPTYTLFEDISEAYDEASKVVD